MKKLIKIYFSNLINPFSIILFLIILLAITLFLYVFSGYKWNELDYILYHESYYLDFFSNSILFITIANYLVVTYLIMNEAFIKTIRLDNILVPRFKRLSVFISKVFVFLVIILVLLLMEYLLLNIMSSVLFSFYYFNINSIIILINLFLELVFFYGIGFLIITIFKHELTSILIFVLMLGLKMVLITGESFFMFKYLFPITIVKDLNLDFKMTLVYVINNIVVAYIFAGLTFFLKPLKNC